MLKVLTVVAAVALAIQGYSTMLYGQASSGEDPQGNENQSGVTFREYLSNDGDVVARLIYESPPTGVVSSAPTGSIKRPPVTFNGFLPYPSPYSSRLPFVVVNEKADFCVLVSAKEGEPRWRFSYSGVGNGVYRLVLEAPGSTAEWYSMSVQHSDSTIGEVQFRRSSLMLKTE